jgi:hypothetical protein
VRSGLLRYLWHQAQHPGLPQDRRLQLTQWRPGLDRELIGEGDAQVPVHAERVGLAPTAVEREHQLGVQLLVERMIPGQGLQVWQELSMLAEREPGLDERPAGPQPQLLQALRLLPQPGQAIDVGQRAPPPQRQRLAQLLCAGAMVGLDALPDKPFGGSDIGVYPIRIE